MHTQLNEHRARQFHGSFFSINYEWILCICAAGHKIDPVDFVHMISKARSIHRTLVARGSIPSPLLWFIQNWNNTQPLNRLPDYRPPTLYPTSLSSHFYNINARCMAGADSGLDYRVSSLGSKGIRFSNSMQIQRLTFMLWMKIVAISSSAVCFAVWPLILVWTSGNLKSMKNFDGLGQFNIPISRRLREDAKCIVDNNCS